VSRNALSEASYGLVRGLSSVNAVVWCAVSEIVGRRGEVSGLERKVVGCLRWLLWAGSQGRRLEVAKSAVRKNAQGLLNGREVVRL
jgi:hypothetical protein